MINPVFFILFSLLFLLFFWLFAMIITKNGFRHYLLFLYYNLNIRTILFDRKTFSCPKIKTDLKTGTSIGDLSPEDIGIISSMGDALATGMGLWPKTNIEFRGAAFPIGGDATIDGLVTIPNILREFNAHLIGVSHGMGSRDQLPETQFSVAESGATTDKMPEQVCSRCTSPNYTALVEAIDILQSSLPKAFVVLLGPIHVSFPYKLKGNLLKVRCACSKEASNEVMEQLSEDWKTAFEMLQNHIDNSPFRTPSFGLLALPELTITSRYPYGLFIPNKPLLNRRGHNYATKWLWNRLIAGNNYNLSAAVLSQDAYFCPSTVVKMVRKYNYLLYVTIKFTNIVFQPRRTRERLYTIAISIVCIAFFVVCTLGTVFYQKSKQGDHGRFEVIDETQKKFEEAQKEEERALINKHNTRVQSSSDGIMKQNSRKLTASDIRSREGGVNVIWAELR
uniref:SGNH_hydro domain-containing protein n=1 Tax=Heterorhabditis bacteriophora TaxID=37862 RepID=A0A1I7W8U8_HETBA